MRNTKAERTARFYASMASLGFDYQEADRLRRIEMTLQRWAELECGDANDYASWAIERDDDSHATCTQCGEKWFGESAETSNCPKCGDCAPVRHKATGKPYMVTHLHTGKSSRRLVPDRERGALRRLAGIMRGHPELIAYHQGDCRGCMLYIVRASDVKPGEDIRSVYTRGFAVCI